MRAIAAGADALCLGHDLFDESVLGVRDALVAAVRGGELTEERLVEAAARVAAVSAWASEHRVGGSGRSRRRSQRRAARAPSGGRGANGATRRSSSSSSPRRAWPQGACPSSRASGFRPVVPDAEPRPLRCGERRPRPPTRRPPARRHRARRAPTCVGAGRDRSAHGACARRDRHRDRRTALAPACRSDVRRDLRSGPGERRIGRRGAILGPATRGGAVW